MLLCFFSKMNEMIRIVMGSKELTTAPKFQTRNARLDDLPQLVELEQEWPVHVRAAEADLALRMKKFAAGFFVASDQSGMIASIISHPYLYSPEDLVNFQSWGQIVQKCYHQDIPFEQTNAIYIVAGTTRKTSYVTELFNTGIDLVVSLAREMGKQYVIAGALLPGFAKYRKKHPHVSAGDYVFTQSQGRYVDPLLEKYRRMGFHVPDKNHVVENYFPDDNSLGFSALVVKDLLRAD
jgi:hypothetical protein